MTLDEHIAKFRNYSKYAVKPLGEKKIERLIQVITNLEELNEIAELIEYLTPA